MEERVFSLLSRRVEGVTTSWNVLVLKGFQLTVYEKFLSVYRPVEESVWLQDGKINLEALTGQALLQRLLAPGEKGEKRVMLYESFLALSLEPELLEVKDKTFLILSNNLEDLFSVQTVEELPDFDRLESIDSQQTSDVYSSFYSYCREVNGHNYVRYIEPQPSAWLKSIRQIDLVEAVPVEFIREAVSVPNTLEIYRDSDLLVDFKRALLETGCPVVEAFEVDPVYLNTPSLTGRLELLNGFLVALGYHLPFHVRQKRMPETCRVAAKTLLKDIYGYDDFRDLEIYKNLFEGRETTSISQGHLVETVLLEAEKGLHRDPSLNNVLLTAPTGSGKSLLFQLPAIYLGQTYQALTIIISPLKALITDQVDSLLELGYTKAAYASSDLSPEEKNEVYRKVREGEVDLFYLSPELLLSYDIRFFIGERRIGLVVVDEAHTVTTWGKEFRVDYWFLGRYIRKVKKCLGYSFPLFALTATAIWHPGGRNDMVFETIRSLHIDPCLLFIGTVRRSNIGFDIKQLNIESSTYDKVKQEVVAGRVIDFLDGHKTIIYYPFAGSIDLKIKTWAMPMHWPYIASYYSKKRKEEKAQLIEEFKGGQKKIMVATKAFGMGIDISDIDRIYHVAPSSTFADYIQEIGRAARDIRLKGIAGMDFHERDFYYMQKLHSVGLITQDQLRLILAKLMELFAMKGGQKNMMVSLSDFEFVVKLPRKATKMEYESDLEQFIKTALLWIEDDLHQFHGANQLLVRPCNLFTEGYVQDKSGTEAFEKKYKKYLKAVKQQPGVYKASFVQMWEDCFPAYSYKDFKRELYNGKLFGIDSRVAAVSRHDVLLSQGGKQIGQTLKELFGVLSKFLTGKLLKEKGRFGEDELLELFKEFDLNLAGAKRFLYSLFESRITEGRSIGYLSSVRQAAGQPEVFTIAKGFDLILARNLKLFDARFGVARAGNRLVFYCTPFSDLNVMLNLLSMLKLLKFSVEGGCLPSLFVRINEPDRLDALVSSGTYCNKVLENNEKIFEEQIEVFTAFLGTEGLTDEQRWNFIEDYFTGTAVDALKKEYT